MFCATQDHAAAVRDLINQMKVSRDPDYCVRVTANDGARGDQFLREFQDNEKSIPTILTTSQKLSTGVDARNVRNIVLMRPVGSMIEFKQIIGRGTRLYDGKDYFTIIDFVKAHHHFNDPDWDGEPIAPDAHDKPYAPREPRDPMPANANEEEGVPAVVPKRIKVRLRDGKERAIQHMMATTYMSGDGSMMSAAQFLESLFGALPEFFKDEDQLREIWSAPETRRVFLSRLDDKGFGHDQMAEMQKIIDAEKSDLFDVLAFVAFAMPPITREARAAHALTKIHATFNDRQEAFLAFVLAQYVKEGVQELDQDKLSPLLKLRYRNSIPDAVADLGDVDLIRNAFIGFQKHLYSSDRTGAT